MRKLISIIVPVYNSGEYLEKCVRSVLNQIYPHFELLLIDDGSKDGSAETGKALCAMDQRIRFLAQPHRGVSAARNAGLSAVNGDYIFFLDSDDTIHPKLLAALLELCEATGAALATEVYRHVEASEPRSSLDRVDPEANYVWKYTYMNNAEALRQFSSRKNGYHFHGIGGKLIRRDVMGALRFDETMTNGEDTVFIYQLLKSGLDAVILWEEWYEYWKHEGNSSQKLTVQSCEDMYRCLNYICEQEQEREGTGGVTFWTLVISARLRRFYVLSRRTHNRVVSRYLRSLAKHEVQNSRFALLSAKEKWKHYLAFWCYPLYLPIHKVSSWIWQRTERKRQRRREV